MLWKKLSTFILRWVNVTHIGNNYIDFTSYDLIISNIWWIELPLFSKKYITKRKSNKLILIINNISLEKMK